METISDGERAVQVLAAMSGQKAVRVWCPHCWDDTISMRKFSYSRPAWRFGRFTYHSGSTWTCGRCDKGWVMGGNVSPRRDRCRDCGNPTSNDECTECRDYMSGYRYARRQEDSSSVFGMDYWFAMGRFQMQWSARRRRRIEYMHDRLR